jgi:hypothetical protein
MRGQPERINDYIEEVGVQLSSVLVKFFAIFFIVLGIAWLVCIRMRWEEISPSPVKSNSSLISISSSIIVSPLIKRVRSPFAKPYHDIAFWTIGVVEVFVAIFYVVAGIFLFKRYVLAKFIVLLVSTFDISLKTLVVVFMKFGAIPLSRLTHNDNMLQAYFMPSDNISNSFSVMASGLKMYFGGGFIYLGCMLFYFLCCYHFISRRDVNEYLRSA